MVRLLAACLLTLLLARPTLAADDAGWVDLFNGKDLTGWSNPYGWGKAWVEDGVICLQADKKFFLVTDKTYGDFELEAQIMLPAEGPANSGIMYRCHVEKNKVFGYQAECDPSDRAWTGGLYDEGRRGWLHPTNAERGKTKLVQAPLGKWISYRIKCVGDHLQVWIDGKQTTDYHDTVDAEGHIGIQHHGEKGKTYKFRNIRIREAKAEANAGSSRDSATTDNVEKWTELFNGKDLTGWTQRGGKANYVVKDGAIVGTSVPNTGNSFLCTDKDYGDFVLEYEFKCHPQLNSGVQIRSSVYDTEKVYDVNGKQIKVPAHRVHGYQVEIDANKPDRAWMSGIYDEARRGWLYPGPKGGNGSAFGEQGRKLYKPEQWNKVRVECQGNRIRTYLNGELRADFEDDLTLSGLIGLQVHGVGKREDPLWVMWRNIRIQETKPTPTTAGTAAEDDGWITLFDGKTFDGWEQHGGKANYKIEDGVIIGTSVPNTSNSFMCSKQTFTDFELVFDVKVHDQLNSGVQIRSRIKDNDRVYGPQCEIEASPGESGFIYGEGMGTGWLSKVAPHKTFKNGEWNTYRIVAKGNNIKTWINGEPIEDITDDRTLAEGFIGLQVHGVGKREDPMFAMWRNIKIKPLK